MRPVTRSFPLLLAALLVLASGCGVIGGGADPTPTSTPTATPTATPTPTPTPMPVLESPALEAAQGGFAVVRVEAVASSAVVTFEGREYELLSRPGGFWGVVGIEADHATGTFEMAVVLQDSRGLTLARLPGTLAVLASGYPVEQIFLEPDEAALLDPTLAAQEEAIRQRVFAGFTAERLWSGPFVLPSSAAISSPYGTGRSYNGAPVSSFHHGTDFAGDESTPVVSANAGRVAFAGALPVRGNSVIVDHGGGVFSGYHHLSSITVTEGSAVATGDLVGFVGATGLVTGPHLHWEVIVNGAEVDPVLWTFEEVGP